MSDATLRVPRGLVGQNVLRRTVRAVCVASSLPLDRVDDLMIICDELLARADGDQTFTFLVEDGVVSVAVPTIEAGRIVTTLASDLLSRSGRLTVRVGPR